MPGPRRPDDGDAVRRLVLLGLASYLGLTLLLLAASLAWMRADDARAEQRAREIRIVATDFAFEPATIDVADGETVRFVIANQGSLPHEFRLTTQTDIEQHLEDRHAGEEHAGNEPGTVLIDPGERAVLRWTFDVGEGAAITRAACLIPGHYEAGMVARVRVR